MILHFTPDAAALLLIDYQVGTLQLAKTNPSDVALRNAITLAKTALAFKMPIIVTSSQEDRIQGRVDERLQHVIPDAWEARVQRQGVVDAWKDRNFKAAVEKTGRRQLIIGAITTDICLVFPSISAVEDGYEVQAVMDACGSPFEINEAISRERLKAANVHMTVTNTIVAELVQDWSTPQGQELVQLLFAAAPMQPVE
ncbi:isochorismatase family protein [Roseomonas mucosa]|nr:isochorismatase family protein [Roseomonas mucosa]